MPKFRMFDNERGRFFVARFPNKRTAMAAAMESGGEIMYGSPYKNARTKSDNIYGAGIDALRERKQYQRERVNEYLKQRSFRRGSAASRRGFSMGAANPSARQFQKKGPVNTRYDIKVYSTSGNNRLFHFTTFRSLINFINKINRASNLKRFAVRKNMGSWEFYPRGTKFG